MKPSALFIGRFQPLHNGHIWLFEQKLLKGIPILIAIRDMPPDEKNPFTAEQSAEMVLKVYPDRSLVTVIIIPDIESVNYGRGVGYEINEFVPPENIGAVSATQIREAIRQGSDVWKAHVNPAIHKTLEKLLEGNEKCANCENCKKSCS